MKKGETSQWTEAHRSGLAAAQPATRAGPTPLYRFDEKKKLEGRRLRLPPRERQCDGEATSPAAIDDHHVSDLILSRRLAS
jgi:hypothetical protein